LLSLINAGILPAGGEPVVIPLALAFGGLIQIFAGVFEFSLANTFGMMAFLAYGAFWWWFALLLLFARTATMPPGRCPRNAPPRTNGRATRC
jgi:succinate-acetate transporter protein